MYYKNFPYHTIKYVMHIEVGGIVQYDSKRDEQLKYLIINF